jgi:integrase
VLLTFETGLRVGELSSIKWSDVDGYLLNVNKREIHYKGDDGKYIYEIVDEAKTDAGTRKVILSENAQRLLKQIRTINPFGEYVFMKDRKRIRGACFTKRLLGICKSLNITQRSEHKARKTYATKLLDAGLNDRLVISQMGHTQIETTRKHYYFNNKNIEQNKKQIEKAIKYG